MKLPPRTRKRADSRPLEVQLTNGRDHETFQCETFRPWRTISHTDAIPVAHPAAASKTRDEGAPLQSRPDIRRSSLNKPAPGGFLFRNSDFRRAASTPARRSHSVNEGPLFALTASSLLAPYIASEPAKQAPALSTTASWMPLAIDTMGHMGSLLQVQSLRAAQTRVASMSRRPSLPSEDTILAKAEVEVEEINLVESEGAALVKAEVEEVAQVKTMMPSVKLLCNWGACDDVCIAALLDVLADLRWDAPKATGNIDASTCGLNTPEGASDSQDTSGFCIFDLGCGDGRVLTDVCKRFTGCRGIGVELNEKLVLAARARAKREGEGVSQRCEFRQEDLAKTKDLGSADAIFLYLPANILRYVVSTIFPKANLKPGTAIFTALEPLPPMPDLYTCVRKSRQGQNHEARRLYWYTWNKVEAAVDSSKKHWVPPS